MKSIITHAAWFIIACGLTVWALWEDANLPASQQYPPLATYFHRPTEGK